MSIITHRTERRIKTLDRNNKKKTSKLSPQKIADILSTTKGHNASKWGRRYIIKKLSNSGLISQETTDKLPSFNNSELAELSKDALGLIDKEFKELGTGKESNASYLLYYWKLKSQRKTLKEPCVYVIGNEDYIKVGYSTNAEKRLAALQVGFPYKIELIKKFMGLTQRDERIFHKRLKEWNTSGEWFKRCKEVEDILGI